jgi:hypothetical protein
MFMSKGLLGFRVIDDLEMVVIDLDAIRIGPHFIEFVLSFTRYDFSIDVMLQDSHLQLVADYLIHGQICVIDAVLSLFKTP